MKGPNNQLWLVKNRQKLGSGEIRASFKIDNVISKQQLTE